MKTLRVNLEEKSYDIIIGKNIIQEAGSYVKKVFQGSKICIITDDNVNKIWGDKVKESLEAAGFTVSVFQFNHGESNKNITTVLDAYSFLLNFKITRSDLVIGLGGGVVGDLAGFVASTFLRGVSFVQIPTTLLSQVDSSVGGKVGIDLPEGKNLVGSFYQPKLVLIDTNTLDTLSEKFFNDGLGEVIKYGLIRDEKLFQQLKNYENKKYLKDDMEYIVYTCCNIKRQVVENDEHDTGERMILNFGHTLGHAIEKVYGFDLFSHGVAVGIGMYLITKISENLGLTEKNTSEEIKNMLVKYELPYNIDIKNKKEIIETITLDKKNIEGNLNVILIENVGKSFIHKTDTSFFEEV